jgi:hypothetical protein
MSDVTGLRELCDSEFLDPVFLEERVGRESHPDKSCPTRLNAIHDGRRAYSESLYTTLGWLLDEDVNRDIVPLTYFQAFDGILLLRDEARD